MGYYPKLFVINLTDQFVYTGKRVKYQIRFKTHGKLLLIHFVHDFFLNKKLFGLVGRDLDQLASSSEKHILGREIYFKNWKQRLTAWSKSF